MRGTWQEVFSRLDSYLREEHKPSCSLPKKGSLLTVDADRRRIIRTQSWGLTAPVEREPEGKEYWRSIGVEASLHNISAIIRFSVRQAADDQTYVEIQFPTAVHAGVFCFDKDEKEFDPKAKAALVRFFIRVAEKLGAAGFGYRLADEDSLFGPLAVEFVSDYIEIEGRWFDRGLWLIIAGLQAALVEEGKVELDVDGDFPLRYRQSGFYIFDLMWPQQ